MSRDDNLKPGTRAIRTGRASNGTAMATPLWSSSVWESAGLDDANTRATGLRASEFYGRYANPTVTEFENAIAELEGAEAAMAFGSGMGAIASTVLALCSSGDHIVATRQLYAGTLAFLQGPCARFGIDLTLVDGVIPGALAAAVSHRRTTLVIAETPSNPLLELIDLSEVGAITGPFTIVDSTFATPLGQQPIAHGVDLVLHSATKGIAGHNDATLGVVAGDKDLIDTIWGYSVLHGATASPFDALNALRGIRTLGVRTAHQGASALRLGEWLAAHPEVTRVHYPGLDSHPQHDLAKRQMSQYGTVLAFDLKGGRDAVRKLLSGTTLARCATSLGGPETLFSHPATTTHASMTPEEQMAVGVTEGLIRLSVGLEDCDDLIADFGRVLATC